MSGTLGADNWDVLVESIQNSRCVPFLGAGACYGVLPLAGELARSWADEYGYTFGNRDNLVEVAQYLAVRFDFLRPKELLLKRFRGVPPPDFSESDEPHATLADLPLPIYVTTNYDDFLFKALERHQFRQPVRDFCRWHDNIREVDSPLGSDFRPHPANPLVYHLHGMLELDGDQQDAQREVRLLNSLVLTEDDYLSFLANLVRQEELLPDVVRDSLRDYTCLFIGYGLADWNLRVILQALGKRLGSKNVAVLLPPGETEEAQAAARKYFEEYYRQALDLRVYWGTAREFCSELRRRLADAT